jgi:hypothetical protein
MQETLNVDTWPELAIVYTTICIPFASTYPKIT